ncbi:hypothetical protein [Rummeliibacillus pycnus]|uniref:hypothetical protein n=1 Tax=Rummeliibacillus pycnus TaxID=101070 RepID=UPI000C9BA7E1|nr:hypothetical protein [Rummeliibacillus pycnus]
MLPFLSMLVIVIFTVITNRLLRKRFANHSMAKCCIMLISMTMSTAVGINMATWQPDMVLCAIASIIISIALAFLLSTGLPVYLFMESVGSSFMGAMMGVMLTLMTTQYLTLSIIFFTMIFIVSAVISIGVWNREMFPIFIKAIPKHIFIVAGLMICVLVFSSFEIQHEVPVKEEQQHHHHH